MKATPNKIAAERYRSITYLPPKGGIAAALTIYDDNLYIAGSGRMRGSLERRGSQRTQADMLVAATAVHHGLALATRNVRDFEDCGLLVVDPFA